MRKDPGEKVEHGQRFLPHGHVRQSSQLASGALHARLHVPQPDVLIAGWERLCVEVDATAECNVIEIGVAKVVAAKVVARPSVVAAPFKDDGAQRPAEPAFDDVGVPCEPAAQIGINELTAVEPHVAQVTDLRPFEATAFELRAAARERQSFHRDAGEIAVDKAAVVRQEGPKLKAREVNALGGYPIEDNMRRFGPEPQV